MSEGYRGNRTTRQAARGEAASTIISNGTSTTRLLKCRGSQIELLHVPTTVEGTSYWLTGTKPDIDRAQITNICEQQQHPDLQLLRFKHSQELELAPPGGKNSLRLALSWTKWMAEQKHATST